MTLKQFITVHKDADIISLYDYQSGNNLYDGMIEELNTQSLLNYEIEAEQGSIDSKQLLAFVSTLHNGAQKH